MRLMTEDQASHIMCPIRHVIFNCIGSKCMGWEFFPDTEKEQTILSVEAKSSPGEWVLISDLTPPEGKGWELNRSYNPHVFKEDKVQPYARVMWHRPWHDHRTGYCRPCEAKVAEVEHN